MPKNILIAVIGLSPQVITDDDNPIGVVGISELYEMREELADAYLSLSPRKFAKVPFRVSDYIEFQEFFHSQKAKINKRITDELEISPQSYIIDSHGGYGDTKYVIQLQPDKIHIVSRTADSEMLFMKNLLTFRIKLIIFP